MYTTTLSIQCSIYKFQKYTKYRKNNVIRQTLKTFPEQIRKTELEPFDTRPMK